MQFGLFDNEHAHAGARDLALPGAAVSYQPGWLSADNATAIATRLKSQLQWHQDTIKLFGKLVKIPRLQAWYGDTNTVYSYSGLTLSPHPWQHDLKVLRDTLQAHTGGHFNSVLANWYRDGKDSMGLHSDDEPELGPQPLIASVTLGQPRPFAFVNKQTKARTTIVLEHGSLLLMQGDTQRLYQHGINKTTRQVGERINLTFRYVYPYSA